MTKHKPETPLPWKRAGMSQLQCEPPRGMMNGKIVADFGNPNDAVYIAHAANAYPRLVEALQMMVEVSATYAPEERAAVSGRINHARALLAELGE